MSKYKFVDIEVGDIITVERLSGHGNTNPTITGEVGFIDHEAVLLTIYICGISQPVCSDNHTLVDIKKKPRELPEIGRPLKIWNARIYGSTCYGVWDGVSFTGVSCEHGPTETRSWPIYEISDTVARAVRWEYLDT